MESHYPCSPLEHHPFRVNGVMGCLGEDCLQPWPCRLPWTDRNENGCLHTSILILRASIFGLHGNRTLGQIPLPMPCLARLPQNPQTHSTWSALPCHLVGHLLHGPNHRPCSTHCNAQNHPLPLSFMLMPQVVVTPQNICHWKRGQSPKFQAG